MAVIKEAVECDRCKMFRATPQIIERRTPSENGELVLASFEADLCDRCGKIVDSAIKRAVKAKGAPDG